MLRAVAAGALLMALAACGGSESTGAVTASSSTSPAASAASFHAAVTRLWHPLKYADPTKVAAAALAAKFDGFGAAVEATPAPADEVSAQASIVSAARDAAEEIRSATDPVAYGAAVGTAQGTIGGLISELPK